VGKGPYGIVVVGAAAGREVVHGSAAGNVICGRGGDRRDILRGGPGNDVIRARDGNRDRVICAAGQAKTWSGRTRATA
jgi:hypothetical protein